MLLKIVILSLFSLLLTGLYLNQDILQAGDACTNDQDNKTRNSMSKLGLKGKVTNCAIKCMVSGKKCFSDCVQ